MSIPTGMIPDLHGPTVVAAIKVTAHGGGAAVEEMGDDPVLIKREKVGILIVADVFAENISDLQFRFLWSNDGGHRWCPPLV
jgi:hypothetical protein